MGKRGGCPLNTVRHLSLAQVWWDRALTWQIRWRSFLTHRHQRTAGASEAEDWLQTKTHKKLLRANGVSSAQTGVTKQLRNPEALGSGFMA